MKIKIFQYKPVEETPVEHEVKTIRTQPRRRRFSLPLVISLLLATLALFVVVVTVQGNCPFMSDDDVTSAEEVDMPEVIAATRVRVQQPKKYDDDDDSMDSTEYEEQIGRYFQEMLAKRKLAVKEGTCDKTKACLAHYYSVWDIDANKTLPAYADYFLKLEENFEHLHEFAIDLICVAQDELKGCLAKEIEEDSCLNVDGYMSTFGLSKLDAREYAADLRVRAFECKNEAFLKENFPCLYPTTQKRKADLDVCSAELRKSIEEKREPCESMDTYISCAREIFISECGAKVSGFVCRLIKTAMGFNYPTCSSVFQTCE